MRFRAAFRRRRPAPDAPASPILTPRGIREMRLNTRAFAIAGGALASAAVFGLTLLDVVGPGLAEPGLRSLSGILFGYTPSVAGAFVGAMWAYAYGFLAAGVLAFVYNAALVPPTPLEGDGRGSGTEAP